MRIRLKAPNVQRGQGVQAPVAYQQPIVYQQPQHRAMVQQPQNVQTAQPFHLKKRLRPNDDEQSETETNVSLSEPDFKGI